MTAETNTPPRPVADWVAARRVPVAVALLALAVACVAVAGFCLLKVTRDGSAQSAAATDPDAPLVAPLKYRSVYLWGGIIGLGLAGVNGLLGAVSLARLPSADPARRRLDAGVSILLVGSLSGFLLLIFGAVLFRLWFDALVKWVDVRDASEAWKPLAALLVLLAGAGLMFLAAQPARADERNHGWIRRTVYGINLGLTVVLMVFGLVALNVIVALKLPAKLDTTANPVYSLSPSTADYIAGLTQPVQVTVSFTPELVKDDPDALRSATDLRRLLEASQEANPRRFKVTTLHPVLNQAELKKAQDEYGQVGVLVETAGQKQFIRAGDLVEGTRSAAFRGEGELVKRMLQMTEDRDRTVYFTQGRGEPEVVPVPDRKTPARTARRVAEWLGRANTTVKPLLFEPLAPRVPDEAAVLVVLAPDQPFTPAEVAAVREYMTKPRTNGKKGKLVFACGPMANREKTAVVANGLDPLLAEFGVLAENKYLLGAPIQGLEYADFALATSTAAAEERHPLAILIGQGTTAFRDCRVVEPAPQPVAPFTATPVGFTIPSRRATWRETEPPVNPKDLYDGVRANPAVQTRKGYSPRGSWPVAVSVTEPGGKPAAPDRPPAEVGRVVVFGSGDAFADPTREGGADNAVLLAAAVDWLRDRPPVAAIAAKRYGVYPPLRAVDTTALLWLPVGITLLSVVALGFGVWSYRRK